MTYRLLSELAEREQALVEGRRWDELAALQAERGKLIASLPSPPPAEAKPVLEQALARSRATEAALAAALEETNGQLAALRRGRRVVSAYGRSRGSRLDYQA